MIQVNTGTKATVAAANWRATESTDRSRRLGRFLLGFSLSPHLLNRTVGYRSEEK